MPRLFRSSLIVTGSMMLATACGSSSSTSSTVADAPATTAAAPAATTAAAAATTAPPATTAAPAATTAAATTAAPVATTAAAAPAATAAPVNYACGPETAGAVAVSLIEWSIKASGPLKAGKTGITVSNSAGNVHEMAIFKADTFASLPKSGNGAVDEAKLAAGTLIGRTEKLNGGKSCPVTVDLQPGKYVLVCNISFGPNSHAAKGQNLDIEVTA